MQRNTQILHHHTLCVSARIIILPSTNQRQYCFSPFVAQIQALKGCRETHELHNGTLSVFSLSSWETSFFHVQPNASTASPTLLVQSQSLRGYRELHELHNAILSVFSMSNGESSLYQVETSISTEIIFCALMGIEFTDWFIYDLWILMRVVKKRGEREPLL